MDPNVWLEDYRLACRAGGATDDLFVIQYLPIYLADSARAWLEYLPPCCIHTWADLKQIFVCNFQGIYKHPGNARDLKSCKQKPDESLHDYIHRFLNQCNQLPDIVDADVIGAFISGPPARAWSTSSAA